MHRAMKAVVVVLGLSVVAAGVMAVTLPERFAVNAPIRQLLFGRGIAAPPETTVESRLRPPAGARLTRYAEKLPNARFLRFTAAGDLLVTLPREGKVVRILRDRDGDGRSDGRAGPARAASTGRRASTCTTAGSTSPRPGAVGRVRFDPQTGAVVGDARARRHGPARRRQPLDAHAALRSRRLDVRLDRLELQRLRREGPAPRGDPALPRGRQRRSRSTRPACATPSASTGGPPTGSSTPPTTAATCSATTSRRASSTGSSQGGFYGWPFANGDRVPDPDFGEGEQARIAASIPPVHGFRAHNAPLGITFLRAPLAPEAYRGAALVALHGSWNRSKQGRLQGRLAPLAGGRHDRRARLPDRLPRRDGRRRDRPAGRRRRGARRRDLRLGRLRRVDLPHRLARRPGTRGCAPPAGTRRPAVGRVLRSVGRGSPCDGCRRDRGACGGRAGSGRLRRSPVRGVPRAGQGRVGRSSPGRSRASRRSTPRTRSPPTCARPTRRCRPSR